MKRIGFVLTLCAALLLFACGVEEAAPAGKSVSAIMEAAQEIKNAPVEEEPAETAAPEESEVPAPSSTSPRPVSPVSYPTVDEDISQLSGTVTYAKVLEMVTDPDPYMGKIVRIQGLFDYFEGESRMYYACVIPDATACCSQGFEFILSGDFHFPEDYPAQNDVITVTGVFDVYYEGINRYVQLIDATLD